MPFFFCWFCLGPLSYGIGATILIGREMLCLPYAGFFIGELMVQQMNDDVKLHIYFIWQFAVHVFGDFLWLFTVPNPYFRTGQYMQSYVPHLSIILSEAVNPHIKIFVCPKCILGENLQYQIIQINANALNCLPILNTFLSFLPKYQAYQISSLANFSRSYNCSFRGVTSHC